MDADKPFEKRFPFKLVSTNLPGAYAVPPPLAGDALATIPNCPSAGLPGNGLILNMTVNGTQVATASANDTDVTINFIG